MFCHKINIQRTLIKTIQVKSASESRKKDFRTTKRTGKAKDTLPEKGDSPKKRADRKKTKYLCNGKLTNGRFRKAGKRVGINFLNNNLMDFKSLNDLIKKSELFGNSKTGTAFDDSGAHTQAGLGLPTGISVRRGSIIDKVTFIYGAKKMEHGGQGGSEQTFSLEKDERIVGVEGSIDYFDHADTIQSLKFTTDKGRVFAVNQPGSKRKFKFETEEGYAICALHGCADRYVRGIGFYALNMKKQDEARKKTGDLLSGMMPGK